jgi:phosphoribosylformylglycinamidine synthase
MIRHHNEIVADIPAKALALGGEMTPVYIREKSEPKYLLKTRSFDLQNLPDVNDPEQMLLDLMASPNIASKHWVYEQYDSMVRTNTLALEGSDAAVIRIKGSSKGIAVKTDCNGRYVYLNPYIGGMIAVAESARNVACVGAKPIAITNCLNFGNPYDPEVYYQFSEAIRGMGDACIALQTPVTGGNVSFYNESPESAVYPTPMIGMLGVIDNIDSVISSGFKNTGDAILLLTAYKSDDTMDGIGGSEYLSLQLDGKPVGNAPFCDPAGEMRLINALLDLNKNSLIKSAHDVSDGGLAVSLAESSILSGYGINVDIPVLQRIDTAYFAECQGRIVVSASQESVSKITEIVSKTGIEVTRLGNVTDSTFTINNNINIPVSRLKEVYNKTLPLALSTVGEG